MGVPNKMTRTSDLTLTPSERPKKVQSFYGNGSDVVVVSNHINAGGLGCPCLGSRFKLGY